MACECACRAAFAFSLATRPPHAALTVCGCLCACCRCCACFQVISCVGAPETATLDPSAPRRIDGDGSVALVEAAAAAGVKQFVMVTSLGTGKVGFPAAVLNLFWGVLSEKRKAEQVRGRGMEGDGGSGEG